MPGADDYSNPMAPPEESMYMSGKQNALRNEDFRRLLATPRVGAAPHTDRRSSNEGGQHSFTHRPSGGAANQGDRAKGPRPKKGGGGGGQGGGGQGGGQGGSKSKKKPSSTAAGAPKKKEGEDDSLDEILKNYRDRAAERRDGETKPVSMPTEADLLQLTAAYRAVPGDGRAVLDAAERRKQAINESKYLGGDMEHTHLVKGLDYSLLQKVRSEIEGKE
uniref:RED-like N-terminal domain-containing protein n=1 Tax=Plectus sambesii TaxID=2011161 RepID=A0A914UX45_9BILA